MHERDFDYLGALLEGRRSAGQSRFVTERTQPKHKAAKQGAFGFIEQCLPGDLVCAGNPKHCTLLVSWENFDGSVFARLWDPEQRCINQRAEGLRRIPKGTLVRWLGVRPK